MLKAVALHRHLAGIFEDQESGWSQHINIRPTPNIPGRPAPLKTFIWLELRSVEAPINILHLD